MSCVRNAERIEGTTRVDLTETVRSRRSARWRGGIALIGLMLVGAVALLPSSASAAPPPPGSVFDLTSFTTSVLDADGAELTKAAGHPHSANATFTFSTYFNADAGWDEPIEDVKTILTDLPPGFVGNPEATGAKCPVNLVPVNAGLPLRCPPESAVGIVALDGAVPMPATGIFNVVPERGYPAQFGFSTAGFTYVLYPELRSDGDYGLKIAVRGSPPNYIRKISVTFCGRGAENTASSPWLPPNFVCIAPDAPNATEKPFLTNPATECTDVAPVTTLAVDSWVNPGVFKTATAVSPLITDCETLTFEPSVDIAPTTSAPDAPTGLDVDLAFPQEDNEHGQAPPALKKAVVTLPEGMSINPSAAGGLAACADGELMLKSKSPMTCPEASRIGTVKAVSPLLDEPVSGGVYIRSQNSSDPGSGEMFRLALVLQNENRGIDVRLPGQVRVDESTGRIETTFDNNPELPVSSIELDLKDGPRAPLATPPTCGTKTIDTTLTSWGKQSVTRQSTFMVSCAEGLGGFSPGFSAGAVNPAGGAFSPFAVSITKPDGDSVLNGVSLKMPTGLLAKVKGNVGTQVGSVRAFAGPGSQPFMLPGTVTLEGPYGDAPYSLRVVVPAKAGPFDLGDVVVRQKVYVDPVTAEVSVVSDPVPTIVKGVPARMQRLDVSVDKPGFMVNPTSCEAKAVTGTLGAASGQTAAVNSRFRVGECAKLRFKPRLGLRLVGRKQVTTGKHPRVRALVRQTGVGEAGIKRAKVVLPKSLALDPDNARALCEFEAGTKPDLENHCPKGSIVGRARAKTPLLERDLVGNVYFVKNVRRDAKTGNEIRTLPMLIVALRGEIAINLKGESSTTRGGRLINTFANVPDAPITQFNMNIKGGRNGILAVTRTRKSKINVCATRQIAAADIDGQNGRVRDFNVRLKTPCTKKQTRKAKQGKADRAGGKNRNRR
jgi:hypothetical protein